MGTPGRAEDSGRPGEAIARGFEVLGLALLAGMAVAVNPATLAPYAPEGWEPSRGAIAAITGFRVGCAGLAAFLGIRRPGFASSLGMALAAALATLGVAEALALHTDLFPPRAYLERRRFFHEFLGPDPRLGMRARAGLEDFRVTWLADAVAGTYSTDALGFRNAGRDLAEATLALIGDSFTWGAWVTRAESFGGRIEVDRGEEVAILACGGYGFAQYEVLAAEVLPRTGARQVVLGVFANDLYPPESPEFLADYYAAAGWDRFEGPPDHRARSLLGRGLRAGWTALRTARRREVGSVRPPGGPTLFRARGAAPDYLASDAPRLVEGALRRVVAAVRRHGATLGVAFLPSKESTHHEAYARYFDPAYLANETGGFRALAAVCEDEGVPWVDLTSAFREAASGGGLYFDRDPHWTPRGHALAAREITGLLRRLPAPGAASTP